MAPGGSWEQAEEEEAAGRAHEADGAARWVQVDMPLGVGNFRMVRVERGLFTPGCGAWT